MKKRMGCQRSKIYIFIILAFILTACSKSEDSFSRGVSEVITPTTITPTSIAAKVDVERETLRVNENKGESNYTELKDPIKEVVEDFIINPPEIDEDIAIMLVKGNFEEKENRNFEVTSTEIFYNVKYYIITVTGKAESAEYPIDVFAISSVADYIHLNMFYDKDKMEYVEYLGTPWFACKTSPDGNFRMESIGMYMDGPSGLHALKEMRMIDTKTGDVLWSGESLLLNNFIWSSDSRFVSIQQGGRTWISSRVIDTKDMSIIKLPEVEDILIIDTTQPKAMEGYTEFSTGKWINDTRISVDFEWTANTGDEVHGRYEYDVLTHEIELSGISD